MGMYRLVNLQLYKRYTFFILFELCCALYLKYSLPYVTALIPGTARLFLDLKLIVISHLHKITLDRLDIVVKRNRQYFEPGGSKRHVVVLSYQNVVITFWILCICPT